MLFFLISPLLGAFLGWLFFFSLSKAFWWSDSNKAFTFGGLLETSKKKIAGLLDCKLFGSNGVLSSKLNLWLEKGETIESLRPSIEKVVNQFVDVTLEQRWPMIGMFLNAEAKEKMKAGLIEEILKAAPETLKNAGNSLINKLEQDQLIESMFAKVSVVDARKAVYPYLQPVFNKLSMAGLLLGFLIALILSLVSLIFC